MHFVSYAQNYEDVILWRAFKQIDIGFYVDVGAQDPEIDSVTKAFYDRGWRGLNIEPVPQWHSKLEEKRTRDINLRVAVGSSEGEHLFYEISDTGLSTLDKDLAEKHGQDGGYELRKYKVMVKTLTSICIDYHEKPIHFMKIDVEGNEKAVIEGINFTKIRPWILVVEATLPNTQIEIFSDWEPLVIAAGYQFKYFDGLNRFYVANEHPELFSVFNTPPNYFDYFIRADELKAKDLSVAAEGRAAELESRVVEAEARAADILAQLENVLNSRSWYITKPLRIVGHLARIIYNKLFLFFKKSIIIILKSCLFIINKSPGLKGFISRLLEHFPFLKNRLKLLSTQPSRNYNIVNEKSYGYQEIFLTTTSERVYKDLEKAIQKRGHK